MLIHFQGMSEALLDPPQDNTEEFTQEFVDELVARIIVFIEQLVGGEFFGYQRRVAMRIVESVIINDAETISFLCARQAGKTSTVANTAAGLMVLMPKLAKVYPDLLGHFKDGFYVGCFAPVDEQTKTLYSRIVSRLTSERAVELMLDPELDDKPKSKGEVELHLIGSGSMVRRQTANPRAKIEGKTYHLLLVDESQDIDEQVLRKSIRPMGAFYAASMVMTGTPSRHKGVFYDIIRQNKRRATRRGARQNHFEYDWRACAKENPQYAKYVKQEMLVLGEDSDDFQLSYEIKWLLDHGMFVTQNTLDQLGDVSMEKVPSYFRMPVVVGIDPARKQDSTVVTVLWVDWRFQDEFGYYDHRILNWLELRNMDWEEQYFAIARFLTNYRVWRVGVDSQGVGDAVAERLGLLVPNVEVIPIPSDPKAQTDRWTHLNTLIERRLIAWPAHAKTRRLKIWQRFYQQMEDAEVHYKGKNVHVHAPEDKDAHDDYVDSLAIAAILTKDFSLPEVEVTENPLTPSRRR